MNSSGQQNITKLKSLFQKSGDVIFNEFTFNQSTVFFIKCDAMVDQQMLYTIVLPNIESLYKDFNGTQITESQIEQLPIPELEKITNQNDLVTKVYNGNIIIYFSDINLLYGCNIARKPNRTPEETNMEVLVKGPRDNFIEDLSTNIALVRKRLPTSSLCVEKMTVGKRSKTEIAILYIDDVVNKDILKELKEQLVQIESDIVMRAESLMEFVNKKNWIFPVFNTTGRPDFVVQSIATGRFAIFVDGTPYGVVTPINFFLLLKTSEDYENPIIYSTFERLLRLIGVFLGVTLPAAWLALTLFHQNQIPLQLLATVVIANRGLPFPGVLEMLLLLIVFELLREAGLRLPTKIGSTISIVGGIIIGDAAIRAGVTSPAMVVIIALSTIASYTIVNQSLVTVISILRIIFILVTGFLGLFGFFVCIFALILYLANIRVFGTPYLDISADLSWENIKKTLFRKSVVNYTKRPNSLDPKDDTRKGESGENE